jgi:hypothetical protein
MEPIDDLIRGAMPRAPRGIADAVERKIAAQRRTRRAFAGVGLFVAAAAALVLWLVARPAKRAPESSWIATIATVTTIDGKPITIDRALPVGALVHVGDGGAATLERPSAGERARVQLFANTDARVADGALELLTGSARLEGPEARLTGDVAEVTTLGVGAAATVELRRNAMLNKNIAALAALLTVGVVDGGARVQAQGHAPVLLAKNDRTMVAPKLPPLTTRAPAKSSAKTAAPKPEPAPKQAATPTADQDDNILDKDVIRTTVQKHMNEIRFCYEQALKDSPKLGGKFVVKFTIVTKDGVGHVSDGEIVPGDEGYLESLSMQSCVLQAFSRWRFPPSRTGEDVVVGYPLVFKAGDDEAE